MRSLPRDLSTALTLAVGVIFVVALVVGLGYPARANVLIVFLCGAGLILVAAELLKSVRKARRAAAEPEAAPVGPAPSSAKRIFDTPRQEDERAPADRRRAVVDVLAWSVGLIAVVWLAGFLVGIPAFAFAYSRTHGGTWLATVSITLIMLALVWGVFTSIMGMQWPDPALLRLLQAR